MATTDEERALLSWVRRQGVGTHIEADYAKGFSGTKMDTVLEKGFADLMLGTDGSRGASALDLFPRQACSCTMTAEGEHGCDCTGKWLRTLNSQGNCYVYVHTISHEIRGSRPPGFVDHEELDAARARRNEAALGGRWHAFPSCHVQKWNDAVMQIWSEDGKVPLLIVDDPETYIELLVKFSTRGGAELVNTRPFVLPVSRTGIKFDDAFAHMAGCMTAAIQQGRPIVLDCQDNSPNWCVDFV